MGSGKRLRPPRARKSKQQPARCRRSKQRIAAPAPSSSVSASSAATPTRTTQAATNTGTQCSHMGFLQYNEIISELSTPSNWNCSNCRSTESVLACLTCAHFGCDDCAKEHYESTGHALAMYIVTKSVRCFKCKKSDVAGDNRNGELALLKEVLENTESRCIPPSRTRSGLMIRRGSRMLGVGELQHSKLNKDQEFTAQSLYRRRLVSRCFRAWVKARKELATERGANAPAKPPVPLGPPTTRTTRARARKRKRGGSVGAGRPARSRLKRTRVPSSVLDGLPMSSCVHVPPRHDVVSHESSVASSSGVGSTDSCSSVSSDAKSEKSCGEFPFGKKAEDSDKKPVSDAEGGVDSETSPEEPPMEHAAPKSHASTSGDEVASNTSKSRSTSPIRRSSSAPLPSAAALPPRAPVPSSEALPSASPLPVSPSTPEPETAAKRTLGKAEPRPTRSALKRRRLSADASSSVGSPPNSRNNASGLSTPDLSASKSHAYGGVKRSKSDLSLSGVRIEPRLTRSAIKRRRLSADASAGSSPSRPQPCDATSGTSNSKHTPTRRDVRANGDVSDPKPEPRLTRSALKRRSEPDKSPPPSGDDNDKRPKSDVKPAAEKGGKSTCGGDKFPSENDSASVNTNANSKAKASRGPAPFKGITGLRNLGNTCFLNSTIQSLGSSRAFRDFFLKFPLDRASRSSSSSSPSTKFVPTAADHTNGEESSDSHESSSKSSGGSASTLTSSASDAEASDDCSSSSNSCSSAPQNPEGGLSVSPKSTESAANSLKNPEESSSSSSSLANPENSSSSSASALRTPATRTRSSRRSVSFLRQLPLSPAPPPSVGDLPSRKEGIEAAGVGLPPRTPGPSSVPPNPAEDADPTTAKKSKKKKDVICLLTPAPSSSNGTADEDLFSPMPSTMTSPAVLLRQSTEFFQKSMRRRVDINEDELDEADEVSLCAELHKLFRVLESGRWAVVTPNHLMVAVWQLMPQFRSYKQQDAHEFFAYFLDCVDEEAKADFDPRTTKRRRLNGQRAAVSGESCEFVRENFESKIVTETRCHNCRNVSRYTFPGAKSISLDMFATVSRLVKNSEPPESPAASKKGRSTPRASAKRKSPRMRTPAASKKPPAPSAKSAAKISKRAKLAAQRRFDKQECTLSDCMDDAFQPTELAGDSQYRCSKCASLQDATKQDRLLTLPNLLVFHVSRAHWSEAGNQKLKNHLKFPLCDLDLSRFCARSEEATTSTKDDGGGGSETTSCKSTYRLIAVIVHHGRRMDRGHYTSFSYSKEESTWLKFNDMKVARCEEEEVLKSQAYMLIYEREKVLKDNRSRTVK